MIVQCHRCCTPMGRESDKSVKYVCGVCGATRIHSEPKAVEQPKDYPMREAELAKRR